MTLATAIAPPATARTTTAASPLYDSESRRPQNELAVRPAMLLVGLLAAAAGRDGADPLAGAGPGQRGQRQHAGVVELRRPVDLTTVLPVNVFP